MAWNFDVYETPTTTLRQTLHTIPSKEIYLRQYLFMNIIHMTSKLLLYTTTTTTTTTTTNNTHPGYVIDKYSNQ